MNGKENTILKMECYLPIKEILPQSRTWRNTKDGDKRNKHNKTSKAA